MGPHKSREHVSRNKMSFQVYQTGLGQHDHHVRFATSVSLVSVAADIDDVL